MTDSDITEFYLQAKDLIITKGFEGECSYYCEFSPKHVTESIFLSEYAWVVLNSGFKESIIRKKFNYISLCFYDWESADKVLQSSESCIELAMASFGNHRKLNGIVQGIDMYNQKGGLKWLQSILNSELYVELELLPYVGKITSKHLAKNLGVSLVKPDRHLFNFSNRLNRDLDSLCNVISSRTGDSLKYIDTVLWRYFALQN